MILMQHFSIGLADCTASLQGKNIFALLAAISFLYADCKNNSTEFQKHDQELHGRIMHF